MWKTLLCKLHLYSWCESSSTEEQRLFDKIQIILYRTDTLKQLQLASGLIRQYEQLMVQEQYPLYMVERRQELIKLWGTRFKLWKRG